MWGFSLIVTTCDTLLRLDLQILRIIFPRGTLIGQVRIRAPTTTSYTWLLLLGFPNHGGIIVSDGTTGDVDYPASRQGTIETSVPFIYQHGTRSP